MALILTVVHPFLAYVVGQDITDEGQMAFAEANFPTYVVRVNADRAEPVPPDPPPVMSGVLSDDTPTVAWTPNYSGPAFVELFGAGAVSGQVEFQLSDGSSFGPQAAGVNGAAPITMSKIAYDGATQNGIALPINVTQGVPVRFSPGEVSGSVSYAFRKG